MEDNPLRLRNLVIKPELNCNANCGFCAQRLGCHELARTNRIIELSQWKSLLDGSLKLGIENLHISGGEPTLYSYLIDIIKYAKGIGINVNLNTNGLLLNEAYINELEQAGLDSCTISLYSFNAKLHERLKDIQTGFDQIISSIYFIQNSKVDLYLQTILCRQNLRTFDQFIQSIIKAKISTLFVSYVEGTARDYFPSKEDIIYFKKIIIPSCIKLANTYFSSNSTLRSNLIFSLNELFELPVSLESIANGQYNNVLQSCRVPFESAIVLANGDVHCCNAIEYFHKPIVGNILIDSFNSIWVSQDWEEIRNSSPGWCKNCPMKYHKMLSFSNEDRIVRQ